MHHSPRLPLAPCALALLALACAACPPPPPAGDAATDATADGDAAPRYAPACTADPECGDGGSCSLAFAGGQCTRACTSDADCGARGICAQGACLQRCTEGTGDCPAEQRCDATDPTDPTRRACLPSCAAGATPACPTGRTCDLARSGVCAAMPATEGHANGAACASGSDCRSGVCLPEFFRGTPTGALDGTCLSYARVPAATEYRAGAPIPASNCPMGSAALPASDAAREGDTALCLPTCTTDGECRPGYACEYLVDGAGQRTSNGVCAVPNCLAAARAAMPNSGCPAGATCQMQPGSSPPAGVCARAMSASDAGTDAARDAASPDASADATSGDARDGA